MAKAKKNSDYNSIFATRLRDLISEHETTITEVANNINVTRQAVSAYQDGSSQPTADTLLKIANYFDVSTDYLLGKSDVQTSDTTIKGICEYTGLSEKATKTLYIISHGLNSRYAKTINFLLENESIDEFCVCDGELSINPRIDKLDIIFLISEYFSTDIDDNIDFFIQKNGAEISNEGAWLEKLQRNGKFLLKDVVNNTLLREIQRKIEIGKQNYNNFTNKQKGDETDGNDK